MCFVDFCSRKNDMGLIVALGEAGEIAYGSLFWDDGESFGMIYCIFARIVRLKYPVLADNA